MYVCVRVCAHFHTLKKKKLNKEKEKNFQKVLEIQKRVVPLQC